MNASVSTISLPFDVLCVSSRRTKQQLRDFIDTVDIISDVGLVVTVIAIY